MTTETHSQHYYDFCNTPIHKRPMAWQRSTLAALEQRLELGDNGQGCFNSPDGYYDAKDRLRQFRAKMANTTECKIDPMGFWYGRMSN